MSRADPGGTGSGPSLPPEPPLSVESRHSTGDMPPEELRRLGHEVVDWIADYLANVGKEPVLPSVRPGELRRALPDAPPERGEPLERALRDFREVVYPAVTHWNHPGFLAYFAVTGSGPGILGEMLAAALNVNAMNWRSSPAGTELEEVALDWVRELVGLPAPYRGVINDTASSSSLYALAAAREAGLPGSGREGLSGTPRARVYASSEAHSSIDKAAITLGLGREAVRRVPVDARFRMRVDALRAAVEEDRADGRVPLAVVATLGTTSTSSMDPADAVAELAREAGLWLHVDAAYAGPAAALPEFRPLFRGWERADSVVLNPHKWLFTPIDCSALYCREPDRLRAVFSLTPEYLRTAEGGERRDLMDYGVSLGRRFRALKLWLVLRYFGAEGIRSRLRHQIRIARELAGRVDEEKGWERVAPTPFSTVVFRWTPDGVSDEAADAANREILERVNASGEAFLSHTVLNGRYCLRVAVGNLRTTRVRLERVWTLLREAAAEEKGPG